MMRSYLLKRDFIHKSCSGFKRRFCKYSSQEQVGTYTFSQWMALNYTIECNQKDEASFTQNRRFSHIYETHS